jgi:hypothetical protein
MNHEGTKNTKEEGKKKNLFTRQLVLDRLLGKYRNIEIWKYGNMEIWRKSD